jgi:hypothetical protein
MAFWTHDAGGIGPAVDVAGPFDASRVHLADVHTGLSQIYLAPRLSTSLRQGGEALLEWATCRRAGREMGRNVASEASTEHKQQES